MIGRSDDRDVLISLRVGDDDLAIVPVRPARGPGRLRPDARRPAVCSHPAPGRPRGLPFAGPSGPHPRRAVPAVRHAHSAWPGDRLSRRPHRLLIILRTTARSIKGGTSSHLAGAGTSRSTPCPRRIAVGPSRLPRWSRPPAVARQTAPGRRTGWKCRDGKLN